MRNNVLAAQYEYDALGKCTILVNDDEMATMNPFRWKGFFYDSETGFYYANGSYYDPETGMYVDAAPVATVIENADSPRYIDRNSPLCYNPLALASSPYTAITTVEMSEDPAYDPGQTWWDRMWGTIGSWWRSIPAWEKALAGTILVIASIGIAVATGGASVGLEAQLLGGAASAAALASAAKVALIEISIGIGFAVAGWAISSAISGNWSVNALNDAVADAIFFAGVFLFISTSVSALKYAYRCNHYTTSKTGNTRGENIVGSTHDTIKPTQDYVYRQTVDSYVSQIRSGNTLSPIQVAKTDKGLFILDGHHRYVASKLTNTNIKIIITNGGPVGFPNWTYVKWV